MKNSQLIIIALALIGVVLVFKFGNIVKPAQEQSAEVHTPDDGHDHSNDVQPADMNTIIDAAKKRVQPAVASNIAVLENAIKTVQNETHKIALLDTLGRIWLDAKYKKIAAFYIGESGKLENSEKKLNFAGHLVFEDIHDEPDPATRKLLANLGTSYYTSSLALNPASEEIILESSQFYIEGVGDVMKGVGQLLALVEKDPGNVPANTVLGRMAVESGQYDKAIERADKLIKLNPKLVEPYLFKAEALKRSGKVEEAVSTLESVKTIVNNPSFSKDVDEYIKTFNK